jgi:FMN phosphatase YigB (HAD superfamily)
MGARAMVVAMCCRAVLAFIPPGGGQLPATAGLRLPRECARGVCAPPRAAWLRMASIDAERIKAISLDVTGTILVHRNPIMETYAAAALWARLPDPPTAGELKPAFKKAYFKHLTESPCFGHAEGLSSRQWWVRTVRSALEFCGRTNYTEQEFNRFFRRVYQQYGSLEGYERLPDAVAFLEWAKERGLTMGVTTNTPVRTMETVPHTFSKYFVW